MAKWRLFPGKQDFQLRLLTVSEETQDRTLRTFGQAKLPMHRSSSALAMKKKKKKKQTYYVNVLEVTVNTMLAAGNGFKRRKQRSKAS